MHGVGNGHGGLDVGDENIDSRAPSIDGIEPNAAQP